MAQETFHVLVLSSKNRLIERCMATLGIADASLIHPREVFRTAIEKSGSGLVIVHNHPSGDCHPSLEDVRVTKQLIDAGRILEIKVLDHVIIGKHEDVEKSIFSMREEGTCSF